MKKVLTLLATVLALGAATAPEAKADMIRVVVGYDCHGCPVYGWRNVCTPRYVEPHCGYAPRYRDTGCRDYGYRDYGRSSGYRGYNRGISISVPGFSFSAGRGHSRCR